VPDIVAVLAGADAVVGSSLHGSITALAFRRPFVLVNLGDESKLEGFGLQTGFEKHVIDDVGDVEPTLAAVLTQPPSDERVEALQAEVDRHFDRLAALVTAPRPAPAVRSRSRRLREACVRRLRK
jgi:polysaccharide pyruvyl transferase WcaK-like protein